MRKTLLVLIAFCFILGSSSLFAQEKKFEFNGLLGYTLSEGVNVDLEDEDELHVTRLSPKSAMSYGVGMDFFLSENFSLGFGFGQEQSKLSAHLQGAGDVDVADMDVNNFHGIFTYNFGDEDAPVRPFIFGGLGATNYSPDPIEGYPVASKTRFSSTWGGGLKFFTTDHFGFRAGVRWTPTYINSEFTGFVCSPFWPWDCYAISESNYSHQFEFNGGVVIRY